MWTWLPRLIGCTTWPMGRPYLSSLCPTLQIAHRHLVAERHVLGHGDRAGRLPFERDDADLLACLQVSHRNADVINRFVDQNAVFHVWISLQ